MQVIHQLWKGRRVRVAGVLEQVAVDCPDDLATIYRDYWELVYRRCYATLEDHEAALDATQDVFLQALNSFEDIKGDVVRGLVDLARTISYERKRRPTREVSLAETRPADGGADDPAEIAERHRMLASVWSGLSVVERRYVADKFAGFSFEEIAQRNRRALGTVSSNLARAREHARRMREPLLPGALALAAWRRLTDTTRRARTLAHTTSVSTAAQPVGAFTVSLTVAGLLVGGVPAAGVATRPSAANSHVRLVTAALPGFESGAAMAGSLAGQRVQVASQSSASGGQPTPIGASAGLRQVVSTEPATAETPEDTQFIAAAPSPNYDWDHTIVALGHGNRCDCQALLMSTDGGTTWTAQAGPPAGDEIVLSPTFPRNAAIYVGVSTGQTAVSNYWTPRFGEAFRSLPGLPAGALTLPAGFDHGDQRIVVTTATGVWSEDLLTGSLQALLLDTATAPPAAATPHGAPGIGVLAVTSSKAIAPSANANAVPAAAGELLWECPPAQPCIHIGTVPLPAGAGLITSPSFGKDRTLLAYGPGQLFSSTDGGQTFETTSAPGATGTGGDLALAAPPQGPSLWATVAGASGWTLMTQPSLQTAWKEADGGNPAIRAVGGKVVVVGSQTILFLLAQGALLCSVNTGVTWEAKCPAV